MTNQNKGIIILVIGAACGIFLVQRIPALLQLLPRLEDPEAAGDVTGIIVNLVVVIVCIVYGIILIRRPDKKSKDDEKNTPSSNLS